MLAGAGFAYTQYRAGPTAPPAPTDDDFFIARLLETPNGKKDWAGADAAVLLVDAEGYRHASGTRVRLMFGRDSMAPLPSAGAEIVSDARLGPVSGPRNPDAFDYRAFLAREGIRHQAWLRSDEFAVVTPAPPPGVLTKVRTWIGERVRTGFDNERDAGVANALLIGDKSGIDEETRLTYTATGAVHVLAVSGLHTGIISAIVVFLLGGIFGSRLPWLQFGLLTATLGAYVALTGFAPSVIRASVMFAVVFGGRYWRKDAQGLNSLGVAAVLTLLYDPGLLLTLGFQLSYLAVAGIMLFYAPLRQRLLTPFARLDPASELAAVSVAATLGTFPVTIYYFHQFPVYFALSGVIAVPLVMYALPLLLGTVAVDALLTLFGVTWAWLYHPAHFLVWLCNAALAQLAKLPYVLVEGLWPSAALCVLLVLTTWSLGVTVLNRRRSALYVSAALATLSAGVALWDMAAARDGAEVIVYSIRDGSEVDVRDGVYVLSASDSVADQRTLTREVMPHRYATGYAPRRRDVVAPVYADSTWRFFAAGDVRWAQLLGDATHLPPMDWQLDWVEVREPRGVDVAALTAAFPGARVLLAQRPPPWERDAWDSLPTPAHYLRDSAFVLAVADVE